jgi:chorismate mutase
VSSLRVWPGALSPALTALAVATAASAGATAPNPLTALVDAANVRLQTADPVAASKWLTKGSIEDPTRAGQVLAAVTADAVSAGIDADYVKRVFTDQIAATEAVEYGRFSEWKLDPSAAPTAAPDLSASRSAIDALNQTMVAEITSHWQLLRSSECVVDRDDAVAAAAGAHQLDALYRQALDFATRSYCRPAD